MRHLRLSLLSLQALAKAIRFSPTELQNVRLVGQTDQLPHDNGFDLTVVHHHHLARHNIRRDGCKGQLQLLKPQPDPPLFYPLPLCPDVKTYD